jgi:hypothetical protein
MRQHCSRLCVELWQTLDIDDCWLKKKEVQFYWLQPVSKAAHARVLCGFLLSRPLARGEDAAPSGLAIRRAALRRGSQVWQVCLNQVQKEAPVNSIYTRAHVVDLDLVGAEGYSSFGILVRGKETSWRGTARWTHCLERSPLPLVVDIT